MCLLLTLPPCLLLFRPPTVVPVAQQPPSDYEVITNLEVAVRALVLQYHKSTKVRSVLQER